MQKRAVRSYGWTDLARHLHSSTIFIRPFPPLIVQLRHEQKNRILHRFLLGQPWRVTSLQCHRSNNTCLLHSPELILHFESLILRCKEVGRRDVSVGLMGEWR